MGCISDVVSAPFKAVGSILGGGSSSSTTVSQTPTQTQGVTVNPTTNVTTTIDTRAIGAALEAGTKYTADVLKTVGQMNKETQDELTAILNLSSQNDAAANLIEYEKVKQTAALFGEWTKAKSFIALAFIVLLIYLATKKRRIKY